MSFKILQLLVFIQFGRPQEFIGFLRPLRLALLLSILSLLFTIYSKDRLAFSVFKQIKESKLFIFLSLIMILGIPFSVHRRAAFDYFFFRYLSDIILFYLLVVHLHSIERLKKIIFVVAISVLFIAGMSLNHGFYLGGRFYPGTMYDPNDFAFFLVSLLPIYFIYLEKNELLIKKLISITGILLSILITLLTGSRGGAIGLGFIFLFILFSKILIQKNATKVFFCLIAGFTILMSADRINIERLTSITNLSSDYNVTSEGGRLEIWRRGLRLLIANPLTGVGVSCFANAIGNQRADDGVLPKWQVAHSSYFEIAVETGIIGFGVFVSLLFACLKNFKRLSSKQIESENAQTGFDKIPNSCLVGLIAAMVCSIFLTQGFSLIFIFYYATSAVLRNLYEQG